MTSAEPNNMRRDGLRTIFALVAVAAAYLAFRLAVQQHFFGLTSNTAKIVVWIPICLMAGLAAAGGFARVPEQIGFRNFAWSDVLPGAAAAAVMATVLGAYFGKHAALPPADIVFYRTITGPITEELLFRGFLVSQLLAAGLGRWPAVLIAAATFGVAHIPNADVWGSGDPATIAGVFAITFGGGVLFGQVMMIARGSVLAAMAFHIGLNFVWEFFAAGQTAIGDVEANVARGAAALAGFIVVIAVARLRSGCARWSPPN